MARDFNGTSDRIDWAAVADLTDDPITISAWIYSDGFAGNADYILEIHASGDGANGVQFYQANTNVIGYSRSGSTSLYRGGGTAVIFTGAWHHVLVTHTGANDYTTIHHYFDGTEYSTNTSATNGVGLNTQTGSWSVGGRKQDDARNFDGKIAEVAVWSTVLGTAEIASLAGRYSAQSIGTSLVFFAPLDLDYVNTVSGVAGTADGTGAATHPTLYYPSTPAQNNQVQVSDAAVPTFYPEGGGVVNLTAAQNNQAQVSDAATLGVYTPIAPSQQNQAQVSDAVMFGVTIPLTAAQNNQAQVSDAAVITVSNPFIVDDIILEWVPDLANISPAQNNQAQVGDAATFGVIHPIAPSQQNQAQVSDAVSITAQAPTYNITVAECNQAQVSDAVTFGVVHPITAADNNQAQVSDTAILTSGEVSISAADNRQAQVSDAVTLSAYYPITPSQQNQSQASDACLLGVIYPITVTDNNQAQVSDAASVTYSGADITITGADNNQAQVMDPASLTAIYILAAVENHQAQVSDLASVSIGGVIEHGERRLYGMNTRPTHAFKTRADLEVDD